jgi:hypothetical protein
MKVWTYHIAPTATVNNIVEKLLSKSWWSTCNFNDMPTNDDITKIIGEKIIRLKAAEGR